MSGSSEAGNSYCSLDLQKQGKAYPRTCVVCGLGPCRKQNLTVVVDPLPSVLQLAQSSSSDCVVVSEVPPEVSVVTPQVSTPLVATRPVSEVAAEFEIAITELEELFTGTEAHYQEWLKDKDTWLRNRAAHDRKAEMDKAATRVAHLESELASASSTLTRRSMAVRSKISL